MLRGRNDLLSSSFLLSAETQLSGFVQQRVLQNPVPAVPAFTSTTARAPAHPCVATMRVGQLVVGDEIVLEGIAYEDGDGESCGMLGVRPRWKTSSTGATTTSAPASASSSSASSSMHRTSSVASPPQDRNLPDPEGGIDELRCSIEHNITGSAVHASECIFRVVAVADSDQVRRRGVWTCGARPDVVGVSCRVGGYVSVKRGTHTVYTVACKARLRAPPRTKLHCHPFHTLTRHHASPVPHTPPHPPHTSPHTPHTSRTLPDLTGDHDAGRGGGGADKAGAAGEVRAEHPAHACAEPYTSKPT